MKKILVIINNIGGLYSFRKELIFELISKNYKVIISAPNGERTQDFINMGAEIIETNISRRGTNPFNDFKLYKQYKKIMKEVKPDIVLTYTIKPNIYGGLAAKKLKIPYIANITGLGTAVENKGILQKITTTLYKIAFKKIDVVFFQNEENKRFFEKNKLSNSKHILLPGSGVNLNKFTPIPYPNNKTPIITYIGRLMNDKGTRELLEAIRIIKEKNINVEFRLIGTYDDQTLEEIVSEYSNKRYLNYLGYQKDVRKYLKETNALINPTYHEGMSNVLLEAAASSRPVLASKVSGCIETFDDGITGFGFEAKNVDSLVETIEKFLNLSNEEMKQMGIEGRKKIEREFDRNIVVNKYLEEINNILK